MLAYAILCYVRAALRPLGLPFGPHDWVRPAIKGAIASLITFAVLSSGLEPNLWIFLPIALAGMAILASWLIFLAYDRGPLADVERRIGAAKKRSWLPRLAIRAGLGLTTGLAVLVLAIGLWFLVPAYTPPVVDAQGNRVSGSIASLETVSLGGADQAILIRGWNTHNPALLVLPGGPGGSYMGEGARLWGALEKRFTVVEWDPRGVGKSYGALQPESRVTMRQIVADTVQLSEILRTRFHQQRCSRLHAVTSAHGQSRRSHRTSSR